MATKQLFFHPCPPEKSLGELCSELNLPVGTPWDVAQAYHNYVLRQVEDNALRVRLRCTSHAKFLQAIKTDLSQPHDYEHVLYRPLRLRVQLVAYHQTSWHSAVAILSSGHMKPGVRGRAGAGIYFAFSPDVTNQKALSHGVVLEVNVAIGKCMDCGDLVPDPTEAAYLIRAGYDSITYTTSSGPELVVYGSDQCTPLRALCDFVW